MTATHRAQKQWALIRHKTINTFENMASNLLYTLSSDSNFLPFVTEAAEWQKSSRVTKPMDLPMVIFPQPKGIHVFNSSEQITCVYQAYIGCSKLAFRPYRNIIQCPVKSCQICSFICRTESFVVHRSEHHQWRFQVALLDLENLEHCSVRVSGPMQGTCAPLTRHPYMKKPHQHP